MDRMYRTLLIILRKIIHQLLRNLYLSFLDLVRFRKYYRIFLQRVFRFEIC